MYLMQFEVKENLAALGIVKKQRFNGMFGRALKAGMVFWHERFIQKHFTREAYSRYGEAYDKPKPGQRKPLVDSGTLRKRIQTKRGTADVRGTHKGVSMKLQYGRPRKFTKKAIERAIFIEMAAQNISYKDAQRRVYSKAGYGRENAKRFQEAISFTTSEEAKQITQHIHDTFMAEAKSKARTPRRIKVA